MSDKAFDKLNPLDQLIRRNLSPGPARSGVLLTITFVSGFELFNTRPYHNYETFSDGYHVTDGTKTVRAEDLDDALAKFFEESA